MEFNSSNTFPKLGFGSFGQRFFAYLIDAFVVIVPFWTVPHLLGKINPAFAIIGLLLMVVLAILYFAIMESSSWKATLGKVAMGLIVTDLNGNRLSFGKSLVRNLLKLILGGFLYIVALFTNKKQAIHDMVANTVVTND